LRAGRQALVLLPEIALTAEFLTRVEARFGAKPAEWHSGVTMTERRRCWKMLGQGEAQLVVGARSALFLPFRDLGLIVVDEEHDSSYKQEEGALYNARDMAVLRASLNDAQVVLASATPSLETWANAEAGKYRAARSDIAVRGGGVARDGGDRHAAGGPARAVVAVADTGLGGGPGAGGGTGAPVSQPTGLCAGDDLPGLRGAGGVRPLRRADGGTPVPQAPRLPPMRRDQTPAGGLPGLRGGGQDGRRGPGRGARGGGGRGGLPDAKIAVLSSDLFGSARALKAQIEEIAEGDTDIIIGTQLVAKGHNFPSPDAGGGGGCGPRAAGRRPARGGADVSADAAGVGARGAGGQAGLALMQTFQPEHPVIRAILGGDEEAFWRAEAARAGGGGDAALWTACGDHHQRGRCGLGLRSGQHLARNDDAIRSAGGVVYGPAPAPIARVRGRHRVRLLVKAPKGAPHPGAISRWIGGIKLPSQVRLSVDIDPQSFY
jgi:primosomal protein N' (replication factor Y)